MKKIRFIDNLINKSSSLFFIISVCVIGRLVSEFLKMYPSENLIHKSIIWLFTPYWNIHIFWGILITSIGFISLVYIEYFCRNFSENYK